MMPVLVTVVLAAGDCAGCHVEAHEAWARSRHASSGANPLYVASFEAHRKRQWCVSCHVPAVTCTSCHLPTQAHGAKVSEQTCARCHDFDVPKMFGLEGPMQNTVDEWRTSQAARDGKGCAGCHDHEARSGHDGEVLAAALRVEVRRVRGELVAKLSAPGVGHAVPTGDPFRKLVLSVGGLRKKVVVPVDQTVELKLGRGPGDTWSLTLFHAEAEVAAFEHEVHVAKGTVE
ncbi:MAG: hypothetical protein JNK82_38185 [Myxococcaceae bacterium]|nr:hypothetical protein [Myxococcaceae bacterium]